MAMEHYVENLRAFGRILQNMKTSDMLYRRLTKALRLPANAGANLRNGCVQ